MEFSSVWVPVSVLSSVIVRVVSSVLNVFVSTRYNDDVFVGSSVSVVVIEFSGVWVPVSVLSSDRVCVSFIVIVGSSVSSAVTVFVGNRGDDIVEVASCVPSVVNVNVFVGDRAKDNVSVRS